MDNLLEPSACWCAFSTEQNGLHYVLWRGFGPEQETTTIGIYDVRTERWTLQPTTGPPPSGLKGGGCAVIANHLYTFCGCGKHSLVNDLNRLSLKTFRWAKINAKQHHSEWPISKEGCGFIPVDETTLACFGGFGKGTTQPGSVFTGSKERRGYTNEFHLFSLEKDVWLSPQIKGERPPPCAYFSFTKMGQDRAVLFGGFRPGSGRVSDLYLFTLRNSEISKVKPNYPWPQSRSSFASCCLNNGDSHPTLLLFGGVDNVNRTLGDMWMVNVSSGKWTEVVPPKSVEGRCHHSITATSLRQGITEVLLFGGNLALGGMPLAETTIFTFECSPSVNGTPTDRWNLVDVANNDTRGSEQRLRNKRRKITQSSMLGYPLLQTSTHPRITFYDEPQEREFPSTGGHADFSNGVEVTVPPHTAQPRSTLSVKVQPGFAPSDVFVMPEGVRSASPAYLISCHNSVNSDRGISIIVEHHVDASSREEADSLIFLEADPTPGEGHVYQYQEVTAGRSEFIPGENRGTLTTNNFSAKFLKIGSKVKNWFKRPRLATSVRPPPPGSSLPDHNLYTVRVYRSPVQTTGDKLAIICVCLFGKLYSKFLEKLDNVLIPHDYPEMSTRMADRTTLGALRFVEMFAVLHTLRVQGWTVEADKEMISKTEADRPETEGLDLHNYPPRITCRLYHDRNAPERTTCNMFFTGLTPEVKICIPLKVSKPETVHSRFGSTSNQGCSYRNRRNVSTSKLQNAAELLRNTVLPVSHTQLGSTARSIVSLMEKILKILRSSSLSDLTVHISSIKSEMGNVLDLSRKVAKDCTRKTIKEAIVANLSKMEMQSHQFCRVAMAKVRHCQNQSEMTAALTDLVESGAALLTTMNCLFEHMKTLSTINAKRRVLYLTKATHLQTLAEAIWDARVKWRNIGRALEVPPDVLDEISGDAQHRDDFQRMESVLVEWLHTGKATVHQLLTALRDRSVRRQDIALEITSRMGEDRAAIGLCESRCSFCTLD